MMTFSIVSAAFLGVWLGMDTHGIAISSRGDPQGNRRSLLLSKCPIRCCDSPAAPLQVRLAVEAVI